MSDLLIEQRNPARPGSAALPTVAGGRQPRFYVISAIVAVALVGMGATGMWLYQRSVSHKAGAAPPSVMPPSVEVPTSEASELEVTLTSDALGRASVKTAHVVSRSLAIPVRVPGAVQSNGYHEVHVTPLVGGVVTKTLAELGQWVKRGQTLAKIFSSELSEAQTQFLTMNAELDAEHKKLKRTEELVAIGAASRQELEEVQASHAVHQSHVQAAEQRLLLLGWNDSQIGSLAHTQHITSEIAVSAPIDGLIVSRMANQGQVVAVGQELFTVTDLSTVWIVGDLFEKDFSMVRVGSKATITSAAYPGQVFQGHVSYFDPRVDPQTRTAKVRVEMPNPGMLLKIGMYVDVSLLTAEGEKAPVVPHSAVQSIGSKQVVYLPAGDDEGKFLQRTVTLGEEVDQYYRVLQGLKHGEQVVAEGSFLLRAESLRQHPTQ